MGTLSTVHFRRMSATFLEATAARTADALTVLAPAETQRPLINCLMLIRWPERKEMIQDAIASFLCQDHSRRVLTVVNDGAPCNLSDSFFAAAHPTNGHAIVTVPGGSSIGEKRNIGAAAVPEADYIASWDDDDFSLPHRLSAHLRAMGDGAVWLSASRKYISITTLDHVVGFEFGRCFGAGMVAKCVVDALPWPHISWCEDQRLYEKVRADARFGGGRGATTGGGPIIDDDTLTYVQRRHDANVSASRRESMWQGVMPLQLAGSDDAIRVVETVKTLLARWRVDGPYLVDDPAS